MKFSHFIQKTPNELNHLILDLRRELFNFRFRVASRDFKETSRIRACRRDIARIKTALTQKRLQQKNIREG